MSRISKFVFRAFSVFWRLIPVLWLSGCGTLWTQKGQYAGVDRLLASGDYAAASAQVARCEKTHYRSKDRILYDLDQGMLLHWMGKHEESNVHLESAERAIEEEFTKSISRAAASLVINDNMLTYGGEDYENVYVNVFKALNYMELNKPDEAFVEIRRIDEKLKVLQDRYWKLAQEYNEAKEVDEPFEPGKSRFVDSALSRWLSLLLYRAEDLPDDARIDLKKIREAWDLQPDIYSFSPPDFSSVLKKPKAGTVKVSFLCFTGQAPEKRADTFWIHTQQDKIFIAASQEQRYGGQRLSGANLIYWPGIEPGYTFKFQMPTMKKYSSEVAGLRIRIDGQAGPALQRIESLENAAVATFDVRKPLIYLKTITRTVTKGIAAAQAQRTAEERWGELYGTFAGLLAGTAVGVTENADLRSSRFFPAEAYIAETGLPPGSHQIEVDYLGRSGTVLYTDTLNAVEIRSSGVNLIESAYLN